MEETLQCASEAVEPRSYAVLYGGSVAKYPERIEFQKVLEMVRGVRRLGMEACCTLGMLSREQAEQLADAGLTAYNHNLDTSPEFYGKIITTRTYQDRLETLAHVRSAGISVCCGGIIGMGEDRQDRSWFTGTAGKPVPSSGKRSH